MAKLELGGTLDLAPPLADSPRILHWGAELRTRVGAGRWAAVVGLGYMPITTFRRNGVTATSDRLAALLGIRFTQPVSDFEIALDCGLAASVTHYTGLELHEIRRSTSIDLGMGVDVVLSPPPLREFGLFLDLRGAAFPRSRDLVALPQGVIGSTPVLWLGAAAGVSFER